VAILIQKLPKWRTLHASRPWESRQTNGRLLADIDDPINVTSFDEIRQPPSRPHRGHPQVRAIPQELKYVLGQVTVDVWQHCNCQVKDILVWLWSKETRIQHIQLRFREATHALH
jgi:hypothetical protein